MFYVIIGKDHPDSLPKRLEARPAHLQRLDELKNQGRLLLAGPFPNADSNNPGEMGFSGSLIVAEFPSLDEAKKWADSDPYVTAGVYNEVEVKPFKKVLP